MSYITVRCSEVHLEIVMSIFKNWNLIPKFLLNFTLSRVFKKVSRDAANFPAAREFSWGSKDITVREGVFVGKIFLYLCSWMCGFVSVTWCICLQVWCSNDYLGMSAHSNVTGNIFLNFYSFLLIVQLLLLLFPTSPLSSQPIPPLQEPSRGL